MKPVFSRYKKGVIPFIKRILATLSTLFLLFLTVGVIDFEKLDLNTRLGGLGDYNVTDIENQIEATKEKGKETVKNVKDKFLADNEVIITRVIDGDTVYVLNNKGKEEKVRLLLIDTPETSHPDKPAQLFGEEAKEYAKRYLKQGTKAVLEKGVQDTDKYGRTLGYLFVDGVNFNKHMVEKGYARVAYVYEPNTKYLDEFLEAEKRAKEKKLNIWSIDGYVTERGFDMSVVE